MDIRSLIPAQFLNQYVWGGVSLSYTGNLMEVWAQLTIRGVGSKGSANTLFAVVDARRSNTQQAVWRMPKNATATIAMGNYSDTPAGATLTFSNGDVELVNLAPYATKVISRNNNGQNSTGIDAESVRVEASGQIGRLITTGVIVSNNGKYASSLRFYDKENTFQSNLYSTNFRLKNSTPSIVLKNTTAGAITARPRFLPRTGEGSGVVELPAVTLPPNAVKELNLTTLINAAATRPDLDSVAVQIINSGEKGSLIGAGNFTDDVTGVDYDIPLRDSGPPQRSAGGYPIRLDGDYSTILSLTNTGNVAGKFTLQINYAGGIYALYPQAVAAGATASFDFRQLRDRQTPDSSGRVLPVDFTIGQIRWSMVGGTATTLIGRSEIISQTDKVSSSYSCGICCRNSYQSSRLTPDQVFAYFGETSQFTAMQKDRDCYGTYFAEYAVSGANWDSSDYSIVDLSYNGMATALNVGDVMITATWDTQYYLDSGSDTCDEYPVVATPTGGMVVLNDILFTTVTNDVNSNTASFSSGVGTPTATVNLGGGRQVCTGDRSSFNITINFDLPPGAESIFHPDTRTFISEGADAQYNYISFNFDGTSYTSGRGKMNINLRRMRPNSTGNSIGIRITGGLETGGSYSGNARVIFTCP